MKWGRDQRNRADHDSVKPPQARTDGRHWMDKDEGAVYHETEETPLLPLRWNGEMPIGEKKGTAGAEQTDEERNLFGENDAYKEPVSGKSGKEAAKDVPSWARGNRLTKDENGNKFAARLMDQKYGKNHYPKGPGTEYNKIRKWGDRGFK